jgi:DNA-binding NarL/FixJ family response regulator
MMKEEEIPEKEKLKALLVDDSEGAIEQFSSWIRERWPEVELYQAQTPEAAIREARDHEVENLVLDLNLGAREDSGVVIARKILEERQKDQKLRTRILFRTVHAGDPGYLRQVEKLMSDERYKPDVWGFLDKGAIPKRLALGAVEQVFIYELSFVDIFNQRLKESPLRELSNLEYTVLIYVCLGVTNDGIGWLIGASRQSVERITTGLYRKLDIPDRRDALKGVPALLESRTRLCYEAITRGLVNPHSLREEDTELKERVKKENPTADRLYVSQNWLDEKS